MHAADASGMLFPYNNEPSAVVPKPCSMSDFALCGLDINFTEDVPKHIDLNRLVDDLTLQEDLDCDRLMDDFAFALQNISDYLCSGQRVPVKSELQYFQSLTSRAV